MVRLAAFTPGDDKALLKSFSSASARYWRLKIVTAAIAPQVAEAMIGARITFPYPPTTPYRPVSEKIEADSTRSKTGELLGTVVRHKPYRISPRWKDLPRSWFESTITPFWEAWASNLKPFFWAWDLDTYPLDVRFVKVTDDYSFEPSLSILSTVAEFGLDLEGVKE